MCDEPHPLLVKEMIQHCVNANIDEAYKVGFHALCLHRHFSTEFLFVLKNSQCELFFKIRAIPRR